MTKISHLIFVSLDKNILNLNTIHEFTIKRKERFVDREVKRFIGHPMNEQTSVQTKYSNITSSIDYHRFKQNKKCASAWVNINIPTVCQQFSLFYDHFQFTLDILRLF